MKLLDFGIAKVWISLPWETQTAQTTLTPFGHLVGTLQYMSPEQLRGQQVDHRSDLFSFGAVAYEMATGAAAFAAPDQASLIAAILDWQPADASAVNPSVPDSFSKTVTKCLAKDRTARWASARVVADELRPDRQVAAKTGPRRRRRSFATPDDQVARRAAARRFFC